MSGRRTWAGPGQALESWVEPMNDAVQTWDEMTKSYPDQWLAIGDYDVNPNGQIIRGVVLAAGASIAAVTKDHRASRVALRYTGESTFCGFRSHADHHAV